MRKFEVELDNTILAFENSSGQPFYEDDEDRKVESINDIMHFYNNIVVYKQYSMEGERFEMFRSNNPDQSIVEYLDEFIKATINLDKENSHYINYENDGFHRETWMKFNSFTGIGYSPSIRILRETFNVKQRHEDKYNEFTRYDVTFTDGLMGDGKAYVLTGLSEEELLEIGKVANEFVDDFIEHYYDDWETE